MPDKIITWPVFLARLRESRGYSQETLSSILGLSPLVVGHWEQGLSTPKTTSIDRIVQYLTLTQEESLALFTLQGVTDPLTWAWFILHLRQDKKISRERLAQILGVSEAGVGVWEHGTSIPHIETIGLLERKFTFTGEQQQVFERLIQVTFFPDESLTWETFLLHLRINRRLNTHDFAELLHTTPEIIRGWGKLTHQRLSTMKRLRRDLTFTAKEEEMLQSLVCL